jgi:16S rRNA processing protein RimM
MSRDTLIDNKKRSTGSLKDSEPLFIAVGKIRKPHGLDGTVVVEVLTDFPERIEPGKHLRIGEGGPVVELSKVRNKGRLLLVNFHGYTDISSVSELRNRYLLVSQTEIPELPEDDFYHHDLIGVSVRDASQTEIGRVEDILTTGAVDVLVCRSVAGKEFLVPAHGDFLILIDIEAGFIQLRENSGILPDLID